MIDVLSLIRRVVSSFLPFWSWGLECEICQMTFISPEAHLRHARKQRTIKKHTGKIPKITCGRE